MKIVILNSNNTDLINIIDVDDSFIENVCNNDIEYFLETVCLYTLGDIQYMELPDNYDVKHTTLSVFLDQLKEDDAETYNEIIGRMKR